MSSPDWTGHVWPCYSCCQQIWIPGTATFGDSCPGIVAYIPAWLALLVFFGRYALRPLWRRRPHWLRSFATEEAERGLTDGRLPWDDAVRDDEDVNDAEVASSAAADADVGMSVDIADDDVAEDSTISNIVGFGRPNSAVDVQPVDMSASLNVLVNLSSHFVTIALCMLAIAGVTTSLTLTFAANHGFLYLTPFVPCSIAALLLATDQPRSLHGTVFFIYTCTLLVQVALLFGVAELTQWPLNITWLAELSITALSLGLMMAMPMRDPRLGNGAENDRISAIFETPSSMHRSPEDNLSLYQWMSVNWMQPVISAGASRQLHATDIWNLPFEFQHARLYRLFHEVKGSVTSRVISANAPDLFITSGLGIFDSVLSMLPIVLLKQLLAAMEGPEPNVRVAFIYAVFICATNIARAQAGVLSLWYSRRCYERSRGELITMVYEKTLRRKAFTFPGLPSPSNKSNVGKNGKRGTDPTLRSGEADDAQPQGGERQRRPETETAAGTAPASTGKILNLMRNDVYEVAQRFWEFPTLFTKPLNFILSIFLLYKMLGAASLLGILVVVLAQVANAFIVKALVRWELARRAVTDIKLQVTSQFIESIRHLRWYDWQDKWLADILTARDTELRYRLIGNVIQKGIFVINLLAAYFFPITAFYAYTVIEKHPLTVDIAFPALNLFNLLEQSLRELPDLITVMLNANVAMRRIEAFMAEPNKESGEDDKGDVLKHVSHGDLVDGVIRPPGPLRVAIEDAAFAWPSTKTPVLSKVRFAADGSSLSVVCGKVGSGKTALLMALLGEMDQHGGSRMVPNETIGYCAQTPWLQSMTVRENILFCLPYDAERYNRVVDACCLLPDFAEFEAGDLSNLGENGIGLSGGQKARVALARAVYSRARILLLDDPIAALDHNTAESLMKRLFSTSGLMRNRLVVFVTHRLDLVADYADQVFEVSDELGIVSKIDADQVRRSLGPSTASSTLVSTGGDSDSSAPQSHNTSDSSSSASQDGDSPEELDTAAVQSANNKFIEEELRAHGGIMFSVYWRYIKAGGLKWWMLSFASFILFRLAKIAYLYFLKIWGEAYGHTSSVHLVSRALHSVVRSTQQVISAPYAGNSTIFEAGVGHLVAPNSTGILPGHNFGLPPPETSVMAWLFWFTILSVVTLVLRWLPDLLLIFITYMAGKRVFQNVMVRVSTAPFRFFDVTPVGRLMNRVTSDIGTIDGAVAQQIHLCVWFLFNWTSSILVIATATPTFLVMAVFMTSLFIFIFFRFLPASQSLRRLEMVSLSPLMSNFGTLLEGLTTVRAFRLQPHFQERLIATTDAFQRMDHFYWSLQAWLQWRFSSLSALSTFVLTITALATGLSSGLIAFVLTAAANFVNSTQVLCRRYGELQMQFVSVERVIELLDLDQEPVGDVDPPAAWPTTNDGIVFDNVTVRYAPNLEPSLREISMRIPAGSTVAVTGRTGSGKSTLALALLGTILPDNDETTRGSICIGSISVASVNKHKLRQRISFVAQDPVLFPGSVRDNLDPMGEHTDEECELVLRRVLSGEFTLSSRVDGGGKNMSQGQRQLVGLGRAVLRRSPIVILDEATASIDKKTAFHIQEVLREELHQSTVITIAHRVEAVRDANFSVVLDHGRVIHAAPVHVGDENAGSSER